MAIEFDPAKSERNARARGLSFDRANEFDFTTADLRVDDREDHGEVRIRAIGFLDGHLHVLIFTERMDNLRIISLRKANRAERKLYDENQS